jgi:hypothetical protein
MSTSRLVGFVFLFTLLASLGGPSGAEDGRPTGSAPTGTDTSALSDCAISTDAAAQTLVVAGGGFACGPNLACDPSTQYCSVVVGGPKGVPPGYSCVDVSAVTAAPTCETIPAIGVGCECTEANGGVTVTCTAP